MKRIIEFIKKIFIYIKEFIIKLIYKIKNYFKSGNYKKIPKIIKEKSIKFLEIIASIFSSIISRNNKESDLLEYLNKVDKKIERIEKSIDNETSHIVIKMYKKDINKKIKKLHNLENVHVREDIKLINKKIDKLEKLEQQIEKVESTLIETKDINKKKDNKINNILVLKNKIIKTKKDNSNKIKSNIINKDNKNNKPIKIIKEKAIPSVIKTTKSIAIKLTKKTKAIPSKLKKGSLFVGTIIFGNLVKKKKVNKNITKSNKIEKNPNKEIIIKIKKINNEINDTYNKVAFIKNNHKKLNELRILKDKVLRLKQEYLLLKKDSKFNDLKKYRNISNIDPNHLVYHDKSIDDLIYYLEKSIKEEKKKQSKPSFDNKEILLIKDSIKKDIELSDDEIKKIRKDMKNTSLKSKRPTLLKKLSTFFKYSISVGISLIPFGIFKNKLFATLTSGIILNNKIKSMKAIMNNEDALFINYENILNTIVDRKSCLENTNYVLTDTVNEIDSLKNKIKLEFMDLEDKENLLADLDETKSDLLEEKIKIEEMLEQINGLNKNKIKKKIVS